MIGIYLTGDSIEEISDEPTLHGKLLWFVLCVAYGSLRVLVAAAQTFYVSFPMSWLSLMILRWARGARADEERPAIGSRHRTAP